MPKSKDDSQRRYQTEQLARERLISALCDHFEFWEEVNLLGIEGDKFRIDAVCKCKKTDLFFGLEFKRSHLYMCEFADALRQGIYYRLARLNDDRLPKIKGQKLRAVAVFPDWLGEHDEPDKIYDREAHAMRILADQFRVGTIREGAGGRFSLIMGQTAIWHSTNGWTGNAQGKLLGSRSLGASRKKDR